MKGLEEIILIDDDDVYNFFTKAILKKAIGFGGKVEVCCDGKEAIDYLENKDSNGDGGSGDENIKLILLDINMPVMNGFEFLEAYKNLAGNKKGKTVLCMLTTSMNESDKKRALAYDDVNDFLIKPLGKDGLEEVIGKYF
ncbi:MAG: response regulator [Flavobacteriales bacterium]|nr:response regulator [Flavobacteriales bacterium]